MKLTRIILAVVALLAIAGTTFGQGEKQRNQSKGGSLSDLSQYTVSARAGAVNIAEGDIAYKRGEADWDMLIAGDELRSGDVVKTGQAGRAEILLNPGSYLRISENTEFVFLDTSLDNLKIEILRGAAIVEVAVASQDQISIATIITPHSTFYPVKGGLYRFDVDAAKTVALVRKGKLAVPQPDVDPTKATQWVAVTSSQSRRMIPVTTIKNGRKIIIEGGQTSLLASGKEEDLFDVWSRDRAQALIAANKRLMNRGVIAAALERRMITRWDSAWNSRGFWIYNPYNGCYTFVPGWYGYSSPYGWGYGYCGCPSRYYPRNDGGWTGGGGWNGGSGGTGGGTGGWTGGTGSTGSKPGGSSVGGFGNRGGSIGGIGTGRGGGASGRGNSGSRPLPPTP
ncbi:MAG: FecR family protein [Acidobacteriota bacterium]